MRARRPTRGPRTRVETREVRVNPPSRSLSVAPIDRAEASRSSVRPANRDFAGGGPYRHPNDRSSRGALRGSAWFPARAQSRSRVRVVTSAIARRSAFARDADASSSSFPPASDQAAARDLSRRQRTGPRLHARALTVEDWNPWTRVAANRGDIHPSASTRMTTSPSRPGPPPRAALVHFAAQGGRRAPSHEKQDGLGLFGASRRRAPRRTPRTAAASPATAVPAPTATRGTRSADETEYHERDPHRKFHPRSGGPLLQAPRSHSRLHRSNPSRSSLRSSGGSGALNDTLGFSCSFKLPSNSQLCRIFSVMSVFVLMLNVATCGFFSAETRRSPWARGGVSAATHADLQQLYERSDSVTQANMAKRDRGAGEHGAGTATDPLAGTTPRVTPAPLMIRG